VTLDNGPRWDEPNPDDPVGTPRAFKNVVRTGARRWFYQDRVWVNHDDLIYFRSWPDPTVPPLSLEESRAFATWIGLGGGIVKLGDKLLDMAAHPEWIDVVRRLLPAWPDGARPLDVLVRDYPEQYREHVVAPAGEWDVVGLIHWGRNRDWSQEPPAPLDETPRTYRVTCDGECLAFEFWSEKFLGRFTGGFDVTVDPRRAQVIALRRPTGAPQLLGDNRHIMQGATDLGPLTWDPATRTLSGTIAAVAGTTAAPWTHHLFFYAPSGYVASKARVDGATDSTVDQQGEVVRLTFTVPTAGTTTFSIAF
jgi:hypothetical protein